jgi:membrane protease YdiL (CAAX protease family)
LQNLQGLFEYSLLWTRSGNTAEGLPSMDATARKSEIAWISGYALAFFCVWWIAVFFYLGMRPTSRAVDFGAFFLLKIAVWIVPAVYYIVKVNRESPWRFLKISTDIKKGLLWSLGLLLILGPIWIYAVVSLRLKPLDLSRWWTLANLWDELIASALIEEIAMRGFILGELRKITGFWTANLLAGLLFVVFHWQHWLSIDPISWRRVFGMSASILVLSLASGYVVKRSNSIWPAVVLHGIQNMISIL